jgi:PST family polysaccharide transporter
MGSRLLRRLLRSKLARNVFSLYGAQAAIWVFPFVTVPYLARVLGVAEWGRYSVALALSTQLALLTECGFGITANRSVARQRMDGSGIGATLGGVVLAKLILVTAACLIATIEYTRVPSFRVNPALFWCAVAAGIAQGANFSWCLYGLEKISGAVALDLGSRFVGVASLVLVKGPADAWKFFAVQALANVAAVALGCAYVVRQNSIRWPDPSAIAAMLRQGLSAMLSRPGLGVYMGLYTFLLGMFATSDAVGRYAGAERIIRGITALTAPLSMAIFPRLNYLLASDPGKLGRLRALGGTASILLGAIASVGVFVFAPAVTRLVLGAGFGGSAAILRILSPLPLLAAANQVLLYQYLLPEGEFDYVAFSLGGATLVALLAPVILGWAGNATAVAAMAGIAEAGAAVFLAARVSSGRARSFVVT